MKKIYIVLFALVSLSSCGSWLDVRPQTEVKKKEMFESQGGFKDALIGAYIRLKTSGLYGGEMTWGILEYLAQHWEYSAGSGGESLSSYNYLATESSLGAIFNNQYKVIADVNSFLELIDEQKGIFEEGHYELIKGEALAIRAFCHFDLLRMFGPMPIAISEGKILPYVKKVKRFPNDYNTWKEYTELLKNDLDSAEMYLGKVDPIIGKEAYDNFWSGRGFRMNYNGVLALQARFEQWIGNHKKAVSYAKKIINAESDGAKIYKLGNFVNYGNYDYSMSSEHIVALYAYNLSTVATNTFGAEGPYGQDKLKIANDLFGVGSLDIRAELWDEFANPINQVKKFTIKKYLQKENEPLNVIPLIRLSEMYLIIIEHSNDYEEVNRLYEEYCLSRKINSEVITNDIQRRAIIQREYNKEFYAEGQTFFAYKRLAATNILWYYETMGKEQYVIPLPKREIDYSNN